MRQPVLTPFEDVQLVTVQVLLSTVGDGLRHSEGYLRQSTGKGGHQRGVTSQGRRTPDRLLPRAGLSHGAERTLQGNALVSLAVTRDIGPVTLGDELTLEHGRHHLRGWRVDKPQSLVQAAAQLPLQPVGGIRRFGDMLMHRLGEEPRKSLHGCCVLIEGQFVTGIHAPYHHGLAHRLAEVGFRREEGTDVVTETQDRIGDTAGSGPVGPFLVGLLIHHPPVLEERKEDVVDVGKVLLPVWGADNLPGDNPYHKSPC
ncbi:MAG: hypothetical protein ACI3Y6_09330 [Candidatus Cryptobacteroides sp.]